MNGFTMHCRQSFQHLLSFLDIKTKPLPYSSISSPLIDPILLKNNTNAKQVNSRCSMRKHYFERVLVVSHSGEGKIGIFMTFCGLV